jgi:hypothetical protein
MASIFSTNLANGTDLEICNARDAFFTELYNLCNRLEITTEVVACEKELTKFLKHNIDSVELLALILYNITSASYPRTHALFTKIGSNLKKIAELRKELELATA